MVGLKTGVAMTEQRAKELFERLVGILAFAMGPNKAQTLDQLAARLGVCRRSIEQTVQEFLPQFPFALVADGAGYYRPTSAQQINGYISSLRSRHLPLKRREETVIHKAQLEGWHYEGERFKEAVQNRQMMMLGV
jgi:hypothetical protein